MTRDPQHRDAGGTRLADPPADGLADVLAHRRVHTLFQPLVDLTTEAVVGFEALGRGPAGTPLEHPEALLAAARAAGRLAELDWLFRDSALAAARAGGLRYPLSLFVNAEPEALGDDPRWGAMGDLRCYAEITERRLVAHPAELLRTCQAVREQDWGIALDDVGAEPESLALMPLLQPDVMKIDVRLLHGRGRRHGTAVLHAVLEQAEATGATVVAEGLETAADVELVRAHGLHLGQGFHLGRPGPLRLPDVHPSRPVALVDRTRDRSVAPGPFAVLNEKLPSRPVSRGAVADVVDRMLEQAAVLQPPPVLLMTAPAPAALPQPTQQRLQALSDRLPLVGVLTPDPPPPDDPGPRHGPLRDGDPARHDWTAVLVSPHSHMGVAARPVPGTGPAADSWDLVLTFDRDLTVAVANSLLSRLP